jgi:hypothetical protein
VSLNNIIDPSTCDRVCDVLLIPGEEVFAAGDGSTGDVLGVEEFSRGKRPTRSAEGLCEASARGNGGTDDGDGGKAALTEADESLIRVVTAGFVEGELGGEEGEAVAMKLPPFSARELL